MWPGRLSYVVGVACFGGGVWGTPPSPPIESNALARIFVPANVKLSVHVMDNSQLARLNNSANLICEALSDVIGRPHPITSERAL